ncbi:DUF3006 domain-containing protein [Cohnella sp. NL03-T5]|nr:DUF3006 domain-containing protein [Cohnella silvisoli]
MERGVIDRFEGEMAIIEIGGITKDFPRASLPHGIKAGDAVILEDGEIRLDSRETARKKQEIQQLMDELFE